MLLLKKVVISVLFFFLCQSCKFETFEERMSDFHGKTFLLTSTFNYYESGDAGSNLKKIQKNNRLYFEYNYFGSKCRIGRVYEKINDTHLKFVDWYFINGKKYCKPKYNWGGPW